MGNHDSYSDIYAWEMDGMQRTGLSGISHRWPACAPEQQVPKS
jgi:hypothetical protein